jgi:hypothetical protein
MLGEQIEELKGKIMGQRVVDVEPLTIETTVSASGTIRGTQVTKMLTFVGSPTTSEGVLHGKGVGMLIAGSEVVTFTAEGVGRLSSSGSASWRGSYLYRTSSIGKLSFLNNMIGTFEGEFDSQGNFSHKSWEWK